MAELPEGIRGDGDAIAPRIGFGLILARGSQGLTTDEREPGGSGGLFEESAAIERHETLRLSLHAFDTFAELPLRNRPVRLKLERPLADIAAAGAAVDRRFEGRVVGARPDAQPAAVCIFNREKEVLGARLPVMAAGINVPVDRVDRPRTSVLTAVGMEDEHVRLLRLQRRDVLERDALPGELALQNAGVDGAAHV